VEKNHVLTQSIDQLACLAHQEPQLSLRNLYSGYFNLYTPSMIAICHSYWMETAHTSRGITMSKNRRHIHIKMNPQNVQK